MSTAVSEPQVEPQHDPSVPDVSLLEDKFPDWFRLPKEAAGFAAVVALVYWFFAMLPIWHTDVWGHLSYGRLIWESRAIPATEPLMPLSMGIPFLDTAWLSQLIGFGAHEVAGRAGLKFLFGASIAISAGLLTLRVYRQTQLSLVALIATSVFLWVDYQQLRTMRPQVAGLMLFCGLIFLMTNRKVSKSAYWIVPVVMAVWANLHGSFTVGLGLLGAFTIGRAIDVLRRTGKLKALFRDARLRQFLVLTELGAVATLLNPYGLNLYTAVLDASSNPNLMGVVEWQPLTLRQSQGQAAAVISLLLLALYRLSPRRIHASEVILIVGLGMASLWSARFVTWWAPVVAVYTALHAGAVIRQWRKLEPNYAPKPRGSFWTVLAMGILWVSFAWSPLGMTTMRSLTKAQPKKDQLGRVIDNDKFVNTVGEHTPEALTRFLVKNPPTGQVFNPYEWGDYLLWAGPKDMKVFVASHAQFISPEVWEDYVATVEQKSGWETQFDRYGINTVILDEKFRGPLIRRLVESENWKIEYRDTQGSVLSRKKRI